MPITQLDMVSMAPKSQEASQIKHNQMVKEEHVQTQIKTEFNNEIKHNSMQTVKTAKTENNEYRYDAKEQGNGAYSYPYQQQKKKKMKDDTKQDDNSIKLSNIDIKI